MSKLPPQKVLQYVGIYVQLIFLQHILHVFPLGVLRNNHLCKHAIPLGYNQDDNHVFSLGYLLYNHVDYHILSLSEFFYVHFGLATI